VYGPVMRTHGDDVGRGVARRLAPARREGDAAGLLLSLQATAGNRAVAGLVQRLHKSTSRMAWDACNVARGQAVVRGVVEVDVYEDKRDKVTGHFHANGLQEQSQEFESFTGTFTVGDPRFPKFADKYHYTLGEDGKWGWQGRAPRGAWVEAAEQMAKARFACVTTPKE
jgi:hypothetical protein